jgi:integrase
VRLLILTMQRRQEVAEMDWSEIDFDAQTWPLPAERAKNDEAHVVPLSPFALDAHMLRIMTERLGHSSPEPSPVVIPDWRFHDIRRTGATNLQALGIPIEVTEAVLNHISGTRAGVAGIYNRYRYDPEKRAALADWDARLQEMLRNTAVPASGRLTNGNIYDTHVL